MPGQEVRSSTRHWPIRASRSGAAAVWQGEASFGSRQEAHKGKRMNHAAGTNPIHAPAFGAAALKQALAGFGDPGAASFTNTIAGHAPGQTAPPPKTVAQVLGEIAWLMTQSPRHKAVPLGDLEWLLMPALLLRQFRIFYSGEQPVGVALWALADDLVAKRIDAGDKRLAAVEWKGGSNLRIIDIVAPFGGEAEMYSKVGDI
jgi:cytolysin-activating lysine-acyltransferase